MTTTLLSDDFPSGPREIPPGIGRLRLQQIWNDWSVTALQGLPLYRREMLVQSYRPRTYVIRAGFAITLFFVALIYAAFQTGSSLITTAVRLPGQGRVILDALVWMLFVFIYVFAPAVAGGVITLEKERQTLVLLFLSKLTSWHIVLEKFLSRLVTTLGILLLAMPLLVFSYSFGGVSVEMLGTSMWFLFVTAVQVTAVAVLCSTLCTRTTQAFVLTYGMLLLLYFVPALLDVWLLDGHFTNAYVSKTQLLNSYTAPINTLLTGPVNQTLATAAPMPAIPSEVALLALFPPVLYTIHYQPATTGGLFQWEPMFLAGYPALLSALVCLALARCFVFYRAFEDKRSPIYERLKGFAKRFRMSYVSERKRSTATLQDVPGYAPIAWRETFRSSANWLPMLLILEVPTIVLLLWLARTGNGHSEMISTVIFVMWTLGILLICVQSSSLFTKERSQQTLDLLMTTPLSSAEIIQQKFDGTRRLMLICAAPLLTCIVFQAWWRTILYIPPPPQSVLSLNPPKVGFVWWDYLITAFCCVFFYFQLAGWIALWAGLRNKVPTRATLDALGGVAFCCFVPQVFLAIPIASMIPLNLALGINLVYLLGAQVSPVVMIAVTEFTDLRDICKIPLLPTIVNSLIYGGLLYYARRYVLDRADRLLGRTVYY